MKIDDESLDMDETAILVMRGAGPIGYPGGAEVVNMRPPAYLIKQGIDELCLHRRRPAVGHLGIALDPERIAGGPRTATGWRW